MKPTCKKLTEWANEEKMSSKEYRKYGFNKISADESRHSKYFSHMKKTCKHTVLLFLFLFMLIFFVNQVQALTNVSGCGTLSTNNEQYVFNMSITPNSGTYCLLVSGYNITIDGAGFSIGNSTYTGNAFYINTGRKNVTIKNVNVSRLHISNSGAIAIANYGDEVYLINNTFTDSYGGVSIPTAINNTFVINNTFTNMGQYDILVNIGSHNNINITGNRFSNCSANGVYFALSPKIDKVYIANNLWTGCQRSGTSTPLRFLNTTNAIIEYNLFNNNNATYSIFATNLSNSRINNNNFTNYDTGGADITLQQNSDYNRVYGNLFNNSISNYYYLENTLISNHNVYYNNKFYCSRIDDSNHGFIIKMSRNITSYNNFYTRCAFGLLWHNDTASSLAYNETMINNSINFYIIDSAENNTGYDFTIDGHGRGDGVHFYNYVDLPLSAPKHNYLYRFLIQNVSYGIQFGNGSTNNTVKDSIIRTSTNSILSYGDAKDNILLNDTYSLATDTATLTANHTRRWYYTPLVKDSGGTALSGVSVSLSSAGSAYSYSGTTDATGKTTPFQVVDYYVNRTGKTIYQPYTLAFSLSGYTSQNQELNFTLNSSVYNHPITLLSVDSTVIQDACTDTSLVGSKIFSGLGILVTALILGGAFLFIYGRYGEGLDVMGLVVGLSITLLIVLFFVVLFIQNIIEGGC